MQMKLWTSKMIGVFKEIPESALEKEWYAVWTNLLMQAFPLVEDFVIAPQMTAEWDRR